MNVQFVTRTCPLSHPNILKGDMSVKEMMAALNFASRDKFLKNYLSPALKAGFVEMTDPNSPKSPKQRYRKVKI